MVEVELPRLVERWQVAEGAFRAVYRLEGRPLVCWFQLLGSEPTQAVSSDVLLDHVREVLASVPAADRRSWREALASLSGALDMLEAELRLYLAESERVRGQGIVLGSPAHRRYEIAHDRVDHLLREVAQDICATSRALLASVPSTPAFTPRQTGSRLRSMRPA